MATPAPFSLKSVLMILIGFTFVLMLAVITPRITGGEESYNDKRSAERIKNLAQVRHDEQMLLTSTEWVDRDKQIVRLPLENELGKTIDDLKTQSLHSCDLLPNAKPDEAPASATPPPAPLPEATANSLPASLTPPTNATGTAVVPTPAKKKP